MPKKRGNGQGSAVPYKDGFRLKWTQPDGAQRSEVIRPCTKRQALARLAAIQTDIERGAYRDERKGNVLFEEWAQAWLEYRRPQARPGTYANYLSLLKHQLLPTFEGRTLNQITRRHVDIWWAEQSARPVSRRNAYYVLKSLFDRACDWNLLTVSPCRVKDAGRDVAAPRPDFTVDDFESVVDALDPFYVPFVRVLFASHCRLGEVLALDGGDVRNGSVTITKQMTVRGVIASTKSGQVKTTELLQMGRDALRALPVALPGAPLFPGERSARMPRQAIQHAWKAATAKAGLPAFRLHDVRHVSLSLLQEVGTPAIVIQRRAGHASPTSTRRYLHESMAMHALAVEKVDELLRRRG